MTTEAFQDFLQALFEQCEDEKATALARTKSELKSEQAAEAAFLAGLPMLMTRRHAQLYIACLAMGRQFGYVDRTDAKQFIYVAQLALAGFGRGDVSPEPSKPIVLPSWAGVAGVGQ